MKKIFFFFFAFVNIGFAQSNFLDSTSRWHEDATFDSGVGPDSIHYQDYEYYFRGDSVVNGRHYFKLFREGIDSVVAQNDPDHGYNFSFIDEPIGLVREDTVMQKVYFIQNQSAFEALLYDFSLSQGDSVPDSYGFPGCTPGNIYDADTFYFGNQTRKRLFVLSTNIRTGGVRIFEGIGANCGFLGEMCIYYDGVYACLHDFYNAADTIHFINCSAVDNIQEDRDIYGVSVFPNPCSNSINYLINYRFTDRATFSLFNYLGEMIRNDELFPVSSGALNLSNFKNGIYLLKFNINDIIVCKKIVKQE